MHDEGPTIVVGKRLRMTAPGNTPPGYFDRKLLGLCTKCGEKLSDDSDCSTCTTCHARILANDRKSRKRRRRQRARARRCVDCREKSDKYRCVNCRAIRKAARATGDSLGERRHEQKLERLRARTAKGDDGRVRFHGQDRRGRQTIAQLDASDIDLAVSELAKAKARLAYVRAPEQQQLPRIQRRSAELEALSHVEMVAKICDETLTRNRVERLTITDDEDDNEED